MERSFDKCIFCKGSGLMLNSKSICDQIIKIINEKISNNKNSKIKVKCNTSLASILINEKKDEISLIEKNNNIKVEFDFNNQFSLHDPIIEIENLEQNQKELKNLSKKNKKKVKTKTNKTIIRTKTRNVTKKKMKKTKKTKEESVIVDKTNEINVNEDEKNEKTGWWS